MAGAAPYDPQLVVQGSGEAVVLVPGLDGTGSLFYRQTARLARAYRVATYALRDDANRWDVLHDDLARVIDAAAPVDRRAIVIGESFGGALALSFALADPARVSALVVLNSFPYYKPQRRLRLAIRGLQMVPWRAMQLSRRLTAFRLHSPHTDRREFERFMDLTAAASRDGYITRLELLRHYDVRHRLSELRPDTLFLASDLDRLVPAVAHARYMAARVSGAQVRVLTGQGHICLLAPDMDLAQIVGEWQGLIPGGGAGDAGRTSGRPLDGCATRR